MSTGASSTALPASTSLPAAGLLLRLAAMAYEAVLLFGVVFVVGYAVVAAIHSTDPLTGGRRLALQVILFLTGAAYFMYQWNKTGQTLAMKAWHVRLVDARGRPPSKTVALLRYVLAWHLLGPGIIWEAAFGSHAALDVLVTLAGATALFCVGLFDPQRRLLHDRLTATRLVRDR